MKMYLLAAVAIVVVACTPEKKAEAPESLVYSTWFSLVETTMPDESRIVDETLMEFRVYDFRMTNRNIVTSPSGKQDITYDTVMGKSYTYTRPNGTLTFERETYNPGAMVAGPNTLRVTLPYDTLDFIKN